MVINLKRRAQSNEKKEEEEKMRRGHELMVYRARCRTWCGNFFSHFLSTYFLYIGVE